MKNTLKKALRVVGYASKPHFIIIGAQKAGTTALYYILNEHPLAVGADEKELNYFANDAWYAEGRLGDYHANWPAPHNLPKGSRLFEATPEYLYHPQVAQRLAAYNPNLKLVVLLREPAARALSAWTMYHHVFKDGYNEHLHDTRPFAEAVAAEMEAVGHDTFDTNIRGIVKRGIYADQLAEYLKHFDRSQLLVLESNELKQQFAQTAQRLFDFLGLPAAELEPQTVHKSKVDNKARYTDTLEALRAFYRPHNQRLYELLGKSYAW